MHAMSSSALRILVTGGTFDKDYHELEGRLHFRATHVQEMLQLGRCKLAVEVETLMLIDSLEMTDADRARILEACRRRRRNAS
jgi:L-asparaginase